MARYKQTARKNLRGLAPQSHRNTVAPTQYEEPALPNELHGEEAPIKTDGSSGETSSFPDLSSGSSTIMAEGKEPAVKKSRYTGSFVSIKVGEGASSQVFNIHEDIIKERSRPLKEAFERQWAECQSRELHIADVQPDVLEGYIDWMYGTDTIGTQHKQLRTYQDIDAAYSIYVRLYVLGEKIEDARFCNTVMENMTKLNDTRVDGGDTFSPSDEIIKSIYEGTSVGSPARAFVVACVQLEGDPEWFSGGWDTYNVEYLLDVARSLVEEKDRGHGEPMFEQRQKWMKQE